MAEIKEFSNFVKEVLPDPSSEAALQALCAAALYPNIESERAIYLYGDGANGKSVFVAAIEGIVRSTPVLITELATTKPLSVTVFRTPLVIVDDFALPKRQRGLACNNIMDILTQSEMRGIFTECHKRVKFRPTCRLLFVSNTPPIWPQGFELLKEWVLPVEMPRHFLEGEANPDLKEFYRESPIGTREWIHDAVRKQQAG